MEKYKVEIEKTPESIVNAIRFFEMEFGESYLEYNDIFSDGLALMEFAFENEYISEEDFNAWKDVYVNNFLDSGENFELVFGDDRDFEPFCITYIDEESDDDYDTQYENALLVYGKLICSNDTYFNEFIAEYSSGEGNLCYVEVVRK